VFSSGVTTLCWLACTNFASILTYGILFGFFAGGVISLLPSVEADFFGTKRMGSVIGLLYSSTATGNLLSAPIGGFLYDKYHNYTPSIIVAGSFLFSGVFFMLLMKLDVKKVVITDIDSGGSGKGYKLQHSSANQRNEMLLDDGGEYQQMVRYQLSTIEEEGSASINASAGDIELGRRGSGNKS
jgi:MFS family permease